MVSKRGLDVYDEHIIALYRYWSDERYAAGFMHPSPGTVAQFRMWLRDPFSDLPHHDHMPLEEFERDFLTEFHAQEAGDDRYWEV